MSVPHIVISYATRERGQKRILNQLCLHCEGMQRDGVLTYFSGKDLEPGVEWEKRIVKEFGKAQAAILLVGPAFQASEFIRDVELPLLQRRHSQRKTLLCPLPVVNFNYQSIPGLKDVQFPLTPDRPLSVISPGDRDTLFATILRHLATSARSISAGPRRDRTSGGKRTRTPTPTPVVLSVRSQKRVTAVRKPTKFVANAGFLIAAEVVSFSEYKTDRQNEIIQRLWSFTTSNSLTKSQRPHFCFERGLGSGILFAFPGDDNKVHYSSIFSCAKELIRFMGKSKVGLRVGIHQGQFTSRYFNVQSGYEVFGSGRRVCERLATIGDGGHIVVEESFLDNWAEASGEEVTRLLPKDGPIEVFSRRRREALRVRVSGDSNDMPPSRLKQLNVIRDKIMGELKVIDEAFCAGLKQLDSDFRDPKQLSVRADRLDA